MQFFKVWDPATVWMSESTKVIRIHHLGKIYIYNTSTPLLNQPVDIKLFHWISAKFDLLWSGFIPWRQRLLHGGASKSCQNISPKTPKCQPGVKVRWSPKLGFILWDRQHQQVTRWINIKCCTLNYKVDMSVRPEVDWDDNTSYDSVSPTLSDSDTVSFFSCVEKLFIKILSVLPFSLSCSW